MRLFDDPNTTSFVADLQAILSERNNDSGQKAETAASALDAFLNARFYPMRINKPSSVPCPVYVRIQNTETGQRVGRSWEDGQPEPEGPDFELKIVKAWFLIIQGGQKPLMRKELKSILILVRDFAKYLKNGGLERISPTPSPSRDGDNLEIQISPDASQPSEEKRKLLAILREELAPLATKQTPSTELFAAKQDPSSGNMPPAVLNWAWVTGTTTRKLQFPIAYYYSAGNLDVGVVNPNGAPAIVHRVLKKRTPEVIWNFGEGWKIPETEKKEIAPDSKTKPHVVYVPLLKRLAIYSFFGPGQNPVELLNAARHISNSALMALRTAFQRAVYSQTLKFLNNRPDSGMLGKGGGHEALLKKELETIIDLYPVPDLQVSESLRFESRVKPTEEQDFVLAALLVERGNGEIKAAREMASLMVAKRNFEFSEVTALGMAHTLKRPLTAMLSLVELIQSSAAFAALPEFVRGRVIEMHVDLQKNAPLIVLERIAYAVIKRMNTSASAGEQWSSTPWEIVDMLNQNKCFCENSAIRQECPSDNRTRMSVFDNPVLLSWNKEVNYPTHASPLALLVYELVENAAKYLSGQHEGFIPDRTITISLDTIITVSNEISRGFRQQVQQRLEAAKAKGAKSIYRDIETAQKIGFSLSWECDDNRLVFSLAPIRKGDHNANH